MTGQARVVDLCQCERWLPLLISRAGACCAALAPALIPMLESNARRSLDDETAYLLCGLFTGWCKCASRDKAPCAHMVEIAQKVLDFVATRQLDMHEQRPGSSDAG